MALAVSNSANDMIFQCATAPDAIEQITVCRDGESASLNLHNRTTGETYYDIPLTMNPNRDYFVESVVEGEGISIEMGFWDADRDAATILQFRATWDEQAEDILTDGPMDMWLQGAGWHQTVEQLLCLPETVLYAPDPLFELTLDRGSVGHFYSVENILPQPSFVGRARVSAPPEGIPVYASSEPNASTARWAQLYDNDVVEVIDRKGEFKAVALTEGVVSECVIRPEDLFQPYTGPCSTGWVDQRYLEIIQ